MKNKILAILLCVVMVVALLPLSASAASTYTVSDDFNYADASALAEVWKGERANFRAGTGELAILANANVSTQDGRSVMLAPQGKVRQSHYVTPVSWPTDKLQKFTTVFFYDADNTLALTQNPSIYVMRIDNFNGLSLIMENSNGNLHLQWQKYSKTASDTCASATTDAVKATAGILIDQWTTVVVEYDYSVEGKVTVGGTVSDGTTTADMTDYTIDVATDVFTAGYGSYAVTSGKHALVYFDSATFEFEGEGEPAPEVDYNPVINGATIKREGSQDLRFNCEFGDIREDKEVAEYGLILTFKQYIDNGDVTADDMVADSTNEYVRVIKSTDVSNVAKGNEFYANVGNIYPEAYGYRYSARVYVKYADGTTIDYSEVLDRSVISVAKAMSKFAYEKQLAGIGDIVSAVNGDSVTWTYDPNTDNGVTILNWIQTNQQAIVDAYNAANQ